MPPTQPWTRYPTPEAKFNALTEPLDGGHVRWTGPMDGPHALFKHAGQRMRPLTYAFRLHHGREPQGTVRPGCGMSHCLAGAHLDDTPARRAHRAAYAVLGL